MSITNLEELENAWGKYVKAKSKGRKKQLLESMKKSLDSVEDSRKFLLERLQCDGIVIKAFPKSEQSDIIAYALSESISFATVEALLHVDISIAEKAIEGCRLRTVKKISEMLLHNYIAYTVYASKEKWEAIFMLCKKTLE